MTRARTALLSLLALAAALLVARRARADQDVHGQVLVVLAQHAAGAVDPRVAQEAALHQPPFDEFRSMGVLSSDEVVVGVGHAATVALPNGRTLRLELEAGQGARLRVRAQITRANGGDYLPGVTVETDPGVPFVVAGQTFSGGTLVLLVTLGARPASVHAPTGIAPGAASGLQRALLPAGALPPPLPRAPTPPAPVAPATGTATQAPGGASVPAPAVGSVPRPAGATAARKNAPPPAAPPAPAPPAGAES